MPPSAISYNIGMRLSIIHPMYLGIIMNKILVHLIPFLLLGQLVAAQTANKQLEITLKHNDQREQQTKQQLQRLLSAYDVSDWIFTQKIIIESGFNVIP